MGYMRIENELIDFLQEIEDYYIQHMQNIKNY